MNEKDFEELMITTGNRPTQIEKIIRGLMSDEFAGIKQRRVKIVIKKIRESIRAIAAVKSNDDKIVIFLDENYLSGIKFFEGKNEHVVRELLRHELAHVLTGKDDDDPAFWQACSERGIKVSP